jgi:predicted alpha/beta-fold hydrolase
VAQKGVVFRTALTVPHCRDVFEQGAGAANGKFGKAMELIPKAGGGTAGLMQAGYYEPTMSARDRADRQPDFSYGTQVYGLMTAARSGGTPAHIYVFNNSDHREVQIVSAHGITGGGGSRRVVQKILEVFKAADPGLQLTDGNI